MRRILLGGLGIALGVLGRPALAQDWPPRPAHTAPQSSERGARLGRPVAVPDTATADQGVTPAGLLSRGQPLPTSQPVFGHSHRVNQPYPPAGMSYPVGQPFVVSQTNPTGLPVPGTPMPGQPMPMQPMPGGMPPMTGDIPKPREIGSNPSITEIRDPSGRVVPGTPYGVPGAVLVPSVGPGGVPCPTPDIDDPMLCPPGGDPFGRLGGLGCPDRFWFSAEYLLWWTRSTQLPTLAATGPGTIVDPATGAFMVPITTPVIGGSFGQTPHSGLRLGAGWWFTDSQCRGIDARIFFLGTNGTTVAVDSMQFPVLARPFVNVNPATGALPADVVSAPLLASGGIAVDLRNSLWGAEVNYRRNLVGCPCSRLDFLVGYRFLNFKEELSITEATIVTPGGLLTGIVPATAASATDYFRTDNNFHGAQIGLAGEFRRGRFSVDGRASIAFGSVTQTADISGSQVQLLPTGPAAFNGGLLALPGANIGHYSQSKFAVVPEVGVNFGYYVTPWMRVFVGYNFLYLSSVLRPAGLINPFVDAARIPNFPLPNGGGPLPGPGQPLPVFRTTDFFAQGISFGLQFKW